MNKCSYCGKEFEGMVCPYCFDVDDDNQTQAKEDDARNKDTVGKPEADNTEQIAGTNHANSEKMKEKGEPSPIIVEEVELNGAADKSNNTNVNTMEEEERASSLIKRVLGSPLVKCVQNHLVEFDIFAVYCLFFIILIDRIFLIDNNEYAISCLIFYGSFIVFEFIQKTWKKKRGHFTIQNRIFLYVFLIIFASFLSFVFIRYKKAPDKEEMYTLKEGETYPVGSKIEFKVKASGMEIEMPKEGDTRSIPYLYSIKSTTGETCVTGGWKDEEYRTTFSINENGKYTLTLTWKKQVYTDGRWTEQGTSTRSLDFYVGQDDVPVALRAPWESNKGTYIAVA